MRHRRKFLAAAGFEATAFFAVTLSAPGVAAPAEAAPPPVLANVGDSYSGGVSTDAGKWQLPNGAAYDPSTRQPDVNECARSTQSAVQLAGNTAGYQVVDLACGGAVTDNLLSVAQWPSEGPQIGRIPMGTAVVHSQIGGNDMGFGAVVACVLTGTCTAQSDAIVEANRILDTVLPSKLDQVYAAIKAQAPSAHVLASGYPPLLPKSAAGLWLCGLYMSPAELDVARGVLDKLNTVIEAAAARNGVTYVDRGGAESQYHGTDLFGLSRDACSPSVEAGAWQLRLLNPDGLNGLLAFSWHETDKGAQYGAADLAPHL